MVVKNPRRVPKIAIIGGGFGGICAAIQLKKQFPTGGFSFTIFDENEDFGGTWWANRYPGAACDAPSHLYSLSFELNPNWSKFYASSPEILQYLLNVAKKYKLYDDARLSTAVLSLEWLESKSEWKLVAQDKTDLKKAPQVQYFNYVICGVGGLRNPNVPPEFSKFGGKVIHSARWDSSLDLSGKVVGVVGSGASTIQIIPAITSQAKEIHSYQREPAWALPLPQFKISKFTQNLFVRLPFFMRCLHWFIFLLYEAILALLYWDRNFIGRLEASFFHSTVKRRMWSQLKGDRSLIEKLTPKYRIGCTRMTFSNDYYSSFAQKHVHLHTEKIEKIQGNIITTSNGLEQKLDVLILATGFHVDKYFAPLQIKGSGGIDLASKWNENGPNCFLGVMTSDAPNLFFIQGPNTLSAQNSAIFIIECQVDFLLKIIKEMEKKGAKSITVCKKVEDISMSKLSKTMKTRIWVTESCGSWYRNERNMVPLWPHTTISLWWALKMAYKNKLNFRWNFDETK